MRICTVAGHWDEQVLPPDAWRRAEAAWDVDSILDLVGSLASGATGEPWGMEAARRIVPSDSLREIGFVHVDSRGALLRPAPTGVHSDLLLWAIARIWGDPKGHADVVEGRSMLRVRNEASPGLAYVCIPAGCVADVRSVLACSITAESRESAMRLASRLTVLTSFPVAHPRSRVDEDSRAPARDTDAHVEQLTPRQMRILEAMAEGMTNRQIAVRICFSESTVRLESMAIYRHFGVHSRTQAVAEAREAGLLREPSLCLGA